MDIKDLTEEYISNELDKLWYPYGLNQVIRYNGERNEEFQTQSVAEHVTNAIFLAYYFRDFEDPLHKLDFDKVIRLILMHDMGEIETGDIVSPAKKAQHEVLEKEAITVVKEKSPEWIAHVIEKMFEEMEHKTTPESRYAQAIDKFEGQMFWIKKEGVEMVIQAHKKSGLDTKIVHPLHMQKLFTMLDTYNFPFIKKFLEVIEKKKYSYGLL